MEKVAVDSETDCWIWTGATRSGYGAYWENDHVHRAHRFAYELMRGPVPDGLVLDHLCERPACVNPDHLEAVTQQVNLNRSERYRETRSKKTGSPQTVGSEAPAAVDTAAAPAGTEDESGASKPARSASEPHDSRKDSLIREIIRLQAEARWSDGDLAEYASSGLHVCSLEQLRFIRKTLRDVIEATKVTKEQKERLRALASPKDIIAAAQATVSSDIRSINDLTSDEAETLIERIAKVREEQRVTA